MNYAHDLICRSRFWGSILKRHIVPWVLDEVQLGQNLLEVGPGPGLSTQLLCEKVENLIVIEVDPKAAASLVRRNQRENVAVVCADATQMPFADQQFDSVVCFTMLHHVPSVSLQDRLLSECCRVLRRGGVFAGWDLVFRSKIDPLHWFETIKPVPPDTFAERLGRAGFSSVSLEVKKYGFRFSGYRE